MALALDDMTAFGHLQRERHELGEQFVTEQHTPSSTDATRPAWPVSRLEVVSIDASKVVEPAGERVSATAHLQNLGELELAWWAGNPR